MARQGPRALHTRHSEPSPLHILIDAIAVASSSGGLVTYLAGLVKGWQCAHPRDKLTIIATSDLPRGIDAALGSMGRVRRLGTSHPLSRIVAQQIALPALARSLAPDAVLSLTPALPLAGLGAASVVTVHDFGYIRRPQDFSLAQRLYRHVTSMYSLRHATRLMMISEATAHDAARMLGPESAPARVVYHGCDHVLDWPSAAKPGGHGLALARWRHKRPDLAIRTWAELRRRDPGFHRTLHIIGARPDARLALLKLASVYGVSDLVRVHGFLSAPSFQRLFTTARLVLMLSTFEGFGLPVLEAMRLGIPVVASGAGGMREAGSDAARFPPSLSPADIADQCQEMLDDGPARRRAIAAGVAHAQQFRWCVTASQTRALLEESIAEQRRARWTPAIE